MDAASEHTEMCSQRAQNRVFTHPPGNRHKAQVLNVENGTILMKSDFLMNCRKLAVVLMSVLSTTIAFAEEKRLLWGDTHLHSSYSVDAFFLGNETADPDTAYRWAKGQPIIHPYNRARLQLSAPLDFLVVSDHAELMGVPRSLMNMDPVLNSTDIGQRYLNMVKEGRSREVFDNMLSGHSGDEALVLHNEAVLTKNWGEIVDTADRHNDPGNFTSLIGWEWSSMIDGANLHRIVVTSGNAKQSKQYLPYSSIESMDPEDLWAWMAQMQQQTGADFISIPHNSNVSKGQMFDTVDQKSEPIDADYAKRRITWEPVMEVTQIKGDSESHPDLSPDDEFADFEYFPVFLSLALGDKTQPTNTDGDYARGALKRGLKLSNELGINPYQFGMIGSTDAHTAIASADEDYFWGKTARDSVPENKMGDALIGTDGWSMSASGLAAVWAEDNTREAIFDALRRREVYASTGPRIQVKLFGGWGIPKRSQKNLKPGDDAVPMGAVLPANEGDDAPRFLLIASKDPDGANLDRVQVIKGWIDGNGEAHEKVYNIGWAGTDSDGNKRKLDDNGTLPAIGSTVDTTTARYSNTIGEAQLAAWWQDPGFDPTESAFYYARVIEIPTPRHSLYDALALGIEWQETGQAPSLQERAYTSPIWYTP